MQEEAALPRHRGAATQRVLTPGHRPQVGVGRVRLAGRVPGEDAFIPLSTGK